MNKSNLLATLLAAAVFAVGISAQAAPVIRLSDDTGAVVQVADGDPLDSAGAIAGAVTFIGAVGPNWLVNSTTGLGQPLFPDPHLDLSSLNVSTIGGVGTFIDVALSDTGFTLGALPALANFVAAIGGTTQGMVTWSLFVDDSDTLFGMAPANLIASGTNNTNPFGDTAAGAALVDGTFSMTLLVRINHGNGLKTTSFDFEGIGRLVPEPGTILLLGAGLLGLGLRRRSA